MRTNIVIDNTLMTDVMRATGSKTKKEAVERAFRTVLRLEAQLELRKLRGKLHWTGDLDDQITDS